jgi:putative ABC transport system permease protein
MGTIVLICRLVARDLRRRPAGAALLLITIAAASATLTLGLTMRAVAASPYLSTRTATAGPDVMAIENGQLTAALTNLEHQPGVTGYSGPFPVAWPVMRAGDVTQPVEAEGRGIASAEIDQPKVTQGSWVRSGGVVVERAFADAAGVHVGDRITLNGRSFTVVGVAVTAAVSAYPNVCYSGCAFNPNQYRADIPNAGLVWLTEPDARGLATPAEPLSYRLNLTLKDPAAAPAFVSAHMSSSAEPFLYSWQGVSQQDSLLVADEQQVLSTGGLLLGLLAIASVAVLAGGRMAEQARRVGLLKAAGATPELVAVLLLAENLILALLAAAVGLTAGWLAAPMLTGPGAGLLGSVGAPALKPSTAVLVALVASAVALTATFAPAIRAASTSTTAALAGAARSPRRGAVLIAISARLPVPLLLGLRLVARHRRRAVLTAASTAVTTMAIAAVLAYRASSRQASEATLANPVADRLDQVMLVLTAAGIVLAAVNAIMTAWATAMDARRSSALARALGATAGQISAGLSTAQLIPVLPGAVIGIPAGIGLFQIVNGGGVTAIPPIWWLAATAAGALTAMAVLTAVTARAAARSSAAQTLEATA